MQGRVELGTAQQNRFVIVVGVREMEQHLDCEEHYPIHSCVCTIFPLAYRTLVYLAQLIYQSGATSLSPGRFEVWAWRTVRSSADFPKTDQETHQKWKLKLKN
jgi:hypothetical protein